MIKLYLKLFPARIIVGRATCGVTDILEDDEQTNFGNCFGTHLQTV